MGTYYELVCKRCNGSTDFYERVGNNYGDWSVLPLAQSKAFAPLMRAAAAFNREKHEFYVEITDSSRTMAIGYGEFDADCDHLFEVEDGYGRTLAAARYPLGTPQSNAVWCVAERPLCSGRPEKGAVQ